jgi:hypothetical protein
MEYESVSLVNLVCAAFFMICTAIFFYYLHLTLKAYLRCRSDTKEELPCPNTCNPGYECKQSEASADFVIGEVVQEGVSEDDKQEEADAEATEVTEDAEVTENAEDAEDAEIQEAPTVAAAN